MSANFRRMQGESMLFECAEAVTEVTDVRRIIVRGRFLW